jgi:RimJ/RimL family protein N-acetyltransferase
MPGPPFVRGETVALHTEEEDDREFLWRHRNDPTIRHGLTTEAPKSRYHLEQEFEQYTGDDSGVGLLICPRSGSDGGDGDDPEPIGKIVLFRIDETEGTGELFCWVAPEAHGQGYGTEATRLMVDHALGQRRLHKVVARALVTNEASRTVLERVGFQEEGIQRDQKYVNGDYLDVVRYSVLRHEWGGA